MASNSGIELGPDRCVLAGIRTSGSGSEIVAIHIIGPDDWPTHDASFAEMLHGVRKSKGFPKDARVVAWGLPDNDDNDDNEAIVRTAMRPIVDAGFRIERVITPPEALAQIARTRRKPGVHNNGVVWMSLNTHGVAIAIVRGSDLLFARTFQWTYNPNLLEGKAQLLQRYVLISHLEPEVRRGIAAVRASHGVTVDAAVTCGDLPELRSLTMPLIEELDLEVETLDSLDGMRPAGTARHERLAEHAPAIRLACAAALMPETHRSGVLPPLARTAAVVALVAVIGYGAYAYFNRAPRPVSAPTSAPPAVVLKQESTPAAPPVATKAAPPTQPPAHSSTARPSLYPPPAAPPQTAQVQANQQAPAPKPLVEKKRTREADAGAPSFAPASRAPEPRTPEPLKEPLPKIDSILIDQDRRLAIIDGAVSSVGDRIGERQIERIERDYVVLREPSGLLVRVPLRVRQ